METDHKARLPVEGVVYSIAHKDEEVAKNAGVVDMAVAFEEDAAGAEDVVVEDKDKVAGSSAGFDRAASRQAVVEAEERSGPSDENGGGLEGKCRIRKSCSEYMRLGRDNVDRVASLQCILVDQVVRESSQLSRFRQQLNLDEGVAALFAVGGMHPVGVAPLFEMAHVVLNSLLRSRKNDDFGGQREGLSDRDIRLARFRLDRKDMVKAQKDLLAVKNHCGLRGELRSSQEISRQATPVRRLRPLPKATGMRRMGRDAVGVEDGLC